jgi:hypothetical protein
MLDFPSSINVEQLVQSFVLYQLLIAQEESQDDQLVDDVITSLLWELIDQLEPIEE